MTFAELILKARRRLFDIRDASQAVITDASLDGIRYTSAMLQDIVIESLHEVIRTLVALKLTNFYNESSLTRIQTCTIKKASGIVTFSEPERVYKVVRIQVLADRKSIHDYVMPDDFFSDTYKNSLSTDNKVFTVLYNDSEKRPEGLVNYIPAADIEAQAVCKVILDELYNVDSTENLPFMNFDDVILDYIELNARASEHNPTQRQFMQQVITGKLQLLTLEKGKK